MTTEYCKQERHHRCKTDGCTCACHDERKPSPGLHHSADN